jgi:2,4-dienoyl-CoA reductase-like NADH-dependent reductase (Old Yellow Enzyme family)
VDIFHCSQRRFWEPEFADAGDVAGLNFAGWAKRVTGLPTITVGSVGLSGEFIAGFGGEQSQPAPIDELVARLEAGEFDLVAVGRALIVDPDWAARVRQGRGDFTPFERGSLATLV